MIAGSGGQGILFAGRLVAQAAMMEGNNVTWFPSYGAEVRGGTANCTVVISEGLIGSPVVKDPDMIVVMNEASLKRFQGRVKKGGLILVNSSLVKIKPERDDVRVLRVPAGKLAHAMGAPLAANVLVCGALARAAGICGLATMRKALAKLTPNGKKIILEANTKALKEGWDYLVP